MKTYQERSEQQQITTYLLTTIDFLDGQGLIVTDPDLLQRTIENEMGTFEQLRKILNS